jgi:hypothetical protein
MKTVIRLILFVVLVGVFSCEKGFITKCQDCTSEEPVTVELEISVDNPVTSTRNVTINIYEGNLEDNILIRSYQMQNREVTYFEAQINKKYTVTANYTYGNRTYIAVDSTIPRIRYEPDECEEPCYYIYNKNLDLRLKYQ